ncbi:MAG: hypothetical protein HUU47_09110 [Bacteroidetes bacterium]|nr:hypothetical protein [Bacteroidota bacterium]
MNKLKFKTFYIAIFIAFSSINSYSQYRFNDEKIYKKHQIYLNGSLSTWGIILKKSNVNFKLKSDTCQFKGHSLPAIQIGYSYKFSDKFSAGILLSTQKLGLDISYMVFKNADFITRRFNDISISAKRRYAGIFANYHFLKHENHDLYGGIRFGAVFWKISPSVTDTDLDSKLNASFPGSMFPAVDLGYRYLINKNFGLGFELSLGIPQILSYGIDYRF